MEDKRHYILWVCPNQEIALERAEAILPPDRKRKFESDGCHMMVTWPGCALVGRRFDEVIFDRCDPDHWHTRLYTDETPEWDWVQYNVFTCLVPSGIYVVYTAV
jgi:hypothetical protein